MLIIHRQSQQLSSAFFQGRITWLSEYTGQCFLLPLKLSANWSSSQNNTYSLHTAVTASIPGNVTKSEAIKERESGQTVSLSLSILNSMLIIIQCKAVHHNVHITLYYRRYVGHIRPTR